MGTTRRHEQDLRRPWDVLLGARSQVRVMRVLEVTRESMTVRETARRADEHLRAVQIAVSRLVESGLAERVGSGPRQLVRWNPDHPLAPALSALFEAERERHDRVVNALARLAAECASPARCVWMAEDPAEGGPSLQIGILSGSRNIDRLVDRFRAGVVALMRTEDLSIEVQGWTLPDLKAAAWSWAEQSPQPRLLWGTLPTEFDGGSRETSGTSRSHQVIDAELAERSRRLADLLRRRPELVQLALEETNARLEVASPQEARTLREWQQALEGMSLPKLVRWLVADGEQATRLRQSMPVVFVTAAKDDASDQRGGSS